MASKRVGRNRKKLKSKIREQQHNILKQLISKVYLNSKYMKIFMFLFLVVVFVACKTTDISPTNEIVGKWKLTSYSKKDINNNIQNTIIPLDKAVSIK